MSKYHYIVITIGADGDGNKIVTHINEQRVSKGIIRESGELLHEYLTRVGLKGWRLAGCGNTGTNVAGRFGSYSILEKQIE